MVEFCGQDKFFNICMNKNLKGHKIINILNNFLNHSS